MYLQVLDLSFESFVLFVIGMRLEVYRKNEGILGFKALKQRRGHSVIIVTMCKIPALGTMSPQI